MPGPSVVVTGGGAPSLLGGLAADAEPQADVGPGVARAGAQAGDGLGDGLIEVIGEPGHVGEGVDVAGGDAAAVRGDSAAQERGVLVVLGDPGAPFGCQGAVDTGSAVGRRGHHRYPPAVQSLHSPAERGM